MGITVSEFYVLSPVEFYYAMEEFAERKMTEQKIVYESMRMQTFYLINVQLEKKSRIQNLTQLMRFPWDDQKPKEVKKQSLEEMKQVLFGIAKTFKKKKP